MSVPRKDDQVAGLASVSVAISVVLRLKAGENGMSTGDAKDFSRVIGKGEVQSESSFLRAVLGGNARSDGGGEEDTDIDYRG